ncbi:protein AKNAD1 [Cavia porcellus]|uniref:protein AKNAD1 n=1 Tax=Cavia porcellus TaxID=10141 RepID=UPI000661CB2B
MDDFSEDTTYKQQEDLPYDGTVSQMMMCGDGNFTSKNNILGVSDQVMLTEDDPREREAHNETCPDTAVAMTQGKITENGFVVDKNWDKEKNYPMTFHISADEGDTSKSNISDILLHHLFKEQFLGSQGIDCETLPETCNADSTDEVAIITNTSSCYVKNFCSKEQTREFPDQLSPKRDGENSRKPSCSPNSSELEELVDIGNSSPQENSDFLTKITDVSDKHKSCEGQEPQKQVTEKASSSHLFKYGRGQVHYQLPDFSKVAPKVQIPKNNLINKSLTIAEQANFSPKLRNKSIIVQDILENLSRSNCVGKQQPEKKEKFTEPSQHIQIESTEHIHQELLTGLESETNLLKLTSASQKERSSNSSSIFQNICQGKQMYQKLKDQTDQLKTKIQEFSKTIQQNSLCHVQDKKLVLEQLQGHLEVLEQEFVATKEKRLALQQQTHEHESPAVGDFDPEREVEGEIFKLEMLLEDVKEKIDESKYTSILFVPVNSSAIPDDLASTLSSSSNEEDPSGASGKQQHAEMVAPNPSCAFCCRLLDWKQKMERNGLRRINCGRFSIIIHENVLYQGATLGCDTGPSFSDSSTGAQHSKCEHCETDIQNSPRVSSKDPLKEFHYRYNTPGQYYLNCGRDAFVQPCSLDENKISAPPCSKPKEPCFQGVNSQSFQDEWEPALGKRNVQTDSADPAIFPPQFQSCIISGSKSLYDFDSLKKTESKILNSALDHALNTASILKKTTDQMIKTIAEDLAKAQRWRNQLKH